jgi:large repetitive protein
MRPRRKSSHSAPRACQSAVEFLEQRTLLTGNVLAAIVQGNLLVVGDSKANQIGIQSTSGGGLQISSLDGTTKINGSTNPFTTNGLKGNVYIFLGLGNDVLQIGGSGVAQTPSPAVVPITTTIPQNLLVVTGNGNDTVNIENTAIGGSAAIIGGIGTDVFTVGSPPTGVAVTVGGNLQIDGGYGNSTLAVFDANVTNNLTLIGNGNNDHIQVGYDEGLGIIGNESDTGHVNVGGNLSITDSGGSSFGFLFSGLGAFATFAECSDPSSFGLGGCFGFVNCGNFGGIFNSFFNCGIGNSSSGGEHVAVADVDVTGNLSISTGSGSDEILVGAAHTPATDSNPLINLVFGPVTVGGNLKINAGAGNDTTLLVEVGVTGNTAIDTGAGNDDVGVLDSSSFTGTFSVRAGRGSDSIVLSTDSFSSAVTIYGGKGQDIVGLADSFFQSTVTINGGPGNDTFLQTQVPFANDFVAGGPILNSVENSSEVSAADFQAAFPWISELLGV